MERPRRYHRRMPGPSVVSVARIWARAPHSAFTDLARFRGQWYCAFRESRAHAGSPGRIRIIVSRDGTRWQEAALLRQQGVDLRDPKLCVAPGNRLMLLMGGTEAGSAVGRHISRRPRVSFSPDGRSWSKPRMVLSDGDWLWRVTWHRSRAWGVSYRVESKKNWTVALYGSADGAAFHRVCDLRIPGLPNEATVRFLPDGRMAALVRREGGDRSAWIGTSRPPHERWRWHAAGSRIGGPNFLVLPDGTMWGAGRLYAADGYRTVIARMSRTSWRPVLVLPSGGDCSYPGLVWYHGLLWVSYYSSHEGRTGIYLAKVRLRHPGRRRRQRHGDSRSSG